MNSKSEATPSLAKNNPPMTATDNAAPICKRRVDETRGEAGPARVDAVDHRPQHSRHRRALSEAHQQQHRLDAETGVMAHQPGEQPAC